jgi:thiol:disulfide interchange protein DsbD
MFPARRDRARAPARPVQLAAALACALLAAGAAAQDEPKLLDPERAFSFSVRALDPATVEARFVIAAGYYLYREKLDFSVEPATLAAPPTLPPGKVKEDEFFGKVETYRGDLVVRLPLAGGRPGTKLVVTARSQGCADIGVCYPPQVQKVVVALPAPGAGPGAPVEAAPAKKAWFK